MIEIFVILAVLLGVFILFYRQAIDQYNILQIESSQLPDLPKLLNERTPLVIRDIGAPKLFTPETLQGNARLQQFPLAPQMTLGSYLKSPKAQVTFNKKAATLLAKESGLSVWAEHMWLEKCMSYPFLTYIHQLNTEAYMGERGLQKATSMATFLYPTSNALEVTLLTEQQGKCLPTSWRKRFPEKFTIQDTPLVGEIKYITIKVRPGNILCIPSHWYYSIRCKEPEKPCLWCKISLENPISSVASMMEGSLDV
jgi:hypothetical protein